MDLLTGPQLAQRLDVARNTLFKYAQKHGIGQQPGGPSAARFYTPDDAAQLEALIRAARARGKGRPFGGRRASMPAPNTQS